MFPDTFIAAYPFWRGAVSVRRSTELAAAMQRQVSCAWRSPAKSPTCAADASPEEPHPAAKLREAAERHEVTLVRLEALVEALARRLDRA